GSSTMLSATVRDLVFIVTSFFLNILGHFLLDDLNAYSLFLFHFSLETHVALLVPQQV
ncbi:hypothetical protein Tco_0473688, partial [Tanacetum coccineum]